MSIPVLNLNKFDNDYIDFVNAKMMPYNIMKGIDYYKRPYFCIKYTANDNINVVTLFQRYTNNINDWRGCGHYNNSGFFDTSSCSIDWTCLNQLVSGNEVTVVKYDTPFILKLQNS